MALAYERTGSCAGAAPDGECDVGAVGVAAELFALAGSCGAGEVMLVIRRFTCGER